MAKTKRKKYKGPDVSSPYKEAGLSSYRMTMTRIRREKLANTLPTTEEIDRPLAKEFRGSKYNPWRKQV